MIRCLKCNKDTEENAGHCQYCNTELPKGILRFLLKISPFQKWAKNYLGQKQMDLEETEETIKNIPRGKTCVMVVADAFDIAGRGTVVVGKIRSSVIHLNDTVSFISKHGREFNCQVLGIEKFRNKLTTAFVGDNVGLLLSSVTKNDIARGTVLIK